MTSDTPSLPIALYVGGAPQPTDDRPMPEGYWRPCPACRNADGRPTGEAMRYRTLFVTSTGFEVVAEAGVGVCRTCSGRRFVRL